MPETPRSLDDAYAAGKAAWPGIALPRLVFDDHAARVLVEDSPRYPEDFYLACACAHEVAGAVQAFERTYAGDLARAVRKVHAGPAFVDDTTQAVRERLFVARPEAPPRIAQYTGRGPLRSWVAAIAVHLAVRLRGAASNRPNEPLDSRAGALLDVPPTPRSSGIGTRRRWRRRFSARSRRCRRASGPSSVSISWRR